MIQLNDKDYKVFERLVSLNQKSLKHLMSQYLQGKYDKVILTKDYIVAIGDIPIALVAHMDTVFSSPVKDLYYDKSKGVLWSPDGLGADDRAGVFAIIKILQDGYRPSVILTTDEEKGGVGASVLAKLDCPIPGLRYMIELDRRGTNDCVFYSCYVPEFIEYVEDFGFCEQFGSFSDISFLMPAWNVCGVNLSVGYEDEHSAIEVLKIKPLYDTIRKVKNMLSQENIPDFKYSEISSNYYGYYQGWDFGNEVYGQHCSYCKGLFTEYDLFPVRGADNRYKYCCPQCLNENVHWCDMCGNAYDKATEKNNAESKYESIKEFRVCPVCAEELCTKA